MRGDHALGTEGGGGVVDKLSTDGLNARLDDCGEVAGVVVTQDRHTRDAESIAARHDVAVSVPGWTDLTGEKLDGDPEPLRSPEAVPDD